MATCRFTLSAECLLGISVIAAGQKVDETDTRCDRCGGVRIVLKLHSQNRSHNAAIDPQRCPVGR